MKLKKKMGMVKYLHQLFSYTRELQHIHKIPNNSKISKLQNMVFACHLEWCIQNACQLACKDSGSSSLRTGFHNQAHLFWSRQSWLHIPRRKKRHYSRTSHLIVAIHLKTNLFCPPQTKLPTATSLKIFGVQKAFAQHSQQHKFLYQGVDLYTGLAILLFNLVDSSHSQHKMIYFFLGNSYCTIG